MPGVGILSDTPGPTNMPPLTRDRTIRT